MTRELFKLPKKRPLVICPKCEGKGWYDYHWQECGNSQIDEWVKEDCRQCNKTGKIEKPVVRVKATKEPEKLVPMADVKPLLAELDRLVERTYGSDSFVAAEFRAKYPKETK